MEGMLGYDYDARYAEGRGILGERPANWAAIG
jgi:hypothetical protein